MNSTEIKAAERKAAFARRKQAFASIPDAPDRAAKVFLGSFDPQPGDILAAYRPIRTELDPTPVMETLHARGVRLCVPVVIGKGRPLVFRHWTPGCAMEEQDFGVSIPTDPVEIIPTMILAPMVAFDRTGTRLGYGGGFYDRTVAALKVPFIGFAFAAQEAGSLPRTATDIPLNAIVTESGLVRPLT